MEYPSDAGGAAAYDISVVIALRDDVSFIEACATEAGLAAHQRHEYKLTTQYADRIPGSRLVPLVAEVGGRWHPSVPGLVRNLARERASRYPVFQDEASAALVSRWSARLSALLIKGNAAVVRHSVAIDPAPIRVDSWEGARTGLPHLLPEGDSSYELVCGGWLADSGDDDVAAGGAAQFCG